MTGPVVEILVLAGASPAEDDMVVTYSPAGDDMLGSTPQEKALVLLVVSKIARPPVGTFLVVKGKIPIGCSGEL